MGYQNILVNQYQSVSQSVFITTLFQMQSILPYSKKKTSKNEVLIIDPLKMWTIVSSKLTIKNSRRTDVRDEDTYQLDI